MRNSRKLLKYILAFILALSISNRGTVTVFADAPYEGYNYDYWENAAVTPIAYAPIKSYSGNDFGVGAFNQPSDIYVTANGDIYICDSGNDRIVIVDNKYQPKDVIDGFDNGGKQDTFNNPEGLFVKDDDNIFVADTDNNRVIRLSKDHKVKQIFENPVSDSFPEGFVFTPLKIGVDNADRLYVVAQNAFEGLITFSPDGKYLGYFGTNNVSVSPVDLFWRRFSTKEQRSKMKLYIPTEFTNLDVDEDGFIYTTDIDYKSSRSIKKFNPSSRDVLKNYNVTANPGVPKTDLIGDLDWPLQGQFQGRSTLVDIKYREKGIYSVLDSKRGRVISYDNEGDILYIFGGLGNQLGMFKDPVAIESYGDNIYVLDQLRGEIICFEATTYGALINKGIGLRYDGDEATAVECWNQVLKMDPGCMIANIGIGKSLLANNQNKEALYYLKAGMDKRDYSVAFKRYRTDVMKKLFPYIVILLMIIVVAKVGNKRFKQRGKKNEKA